MNLPLSVSIGEATNSGIKAVNQDYIGHSIPKEPLLSSKGIVLAMADGISSSQVSQVASESAISGFLDDYYCTSDAWSVENSVQKVAQAINSWLYTQTYNSPYRFDKDKGYVCTFSALVLKANTAHIFHTGDTRIYQLSGDNLEQLTEDHRRIVSPEKSYLTKALGIHPNITLDYQGKKLVQGDIYILATDGIYEFLNEEEIVQTINESSSLNKAAEALVASALKLGSDDNLSIQIVRINHIAQYQLGEVNELTNLPLPPKLSPRMTIDNYEILREIYISSRSHVYLAKDNETQQNVVIKVPSTELSTDNLYIERFLLEEWIGKRIKNPHVAIAILPKHRRNFLYLVTEYIEGRTLTQWIIDNPTPKLEHVRDIVEQIAKGLQAFHRQEMVHQDLRPENIMIDNSNVVKIIDFGSTYIAGVNDDHDDTSDNMRGTMRYSAPEYFLGQSGTPQSDIFSLAVITYQMLSGKFPYHVNIAQAKSISAQRKLKYRSIIDDDSELPLWIDDALQKALNIQPLKRHSVLSEFIADLRRPNKAFETRTLPPLIQRDPVMFWQIVSCLLFMVILLQQFIT